MNVVKRDDSAVQKFDLAQFPQAEQFVERCAPDAEYAACFRDIDRPVFRAIEAAQIGLRDAMRGPAHAG